MTDTERNQNNPDYTTSHPNKDSFSRIMAIAAIVIALVAALIAYLQFSQAKDTTVRGLRGYLGVEPIDYVIDYTNGKVIMNYRIINYGQTPVKDVQAFGEVRILEYPTKDIIGFVHKKLTTEKQGGVIFPNQSSNSNIGRVSTLQKLTRGQIDSALSTESDNSIHAFITITYRDIFNLDRVTKYGAFLERTENRQGEFFGTWIPITDYNSFN